MRIRNFASTLNFAKATLNEDRVDDNVNFEKNFNSIMKQASIYIKKLARRKEVSEDITDQELNSLILDDYNRLLDETYQNTDIPLISMKYVAVKYLSKHRNEIPGLLKEIDERGLVYSENESYTDDFHENLLIALLAVQEDYEQYCANMKLTNPEFLAEIEALVAEHGNVGGFKKYCEKYSKMKGLPFNSRRQIISYGYLSIFGLEGIDETTVPEGSAVLKYKASNFVKDYINGYLERLEPIYRENLENSILSSFEQLEQFGEIYSGIKKHNDKMKRIGLPGLGYARPEKETLPSGTVLPKVEDLMNRNNLASQDIDVLLRMNSFYNNRLAKVINDYSMAIFTIDNLGLARQVYEGKAPTKADISEETLEQLMIKYKTLILPIKAFYAITQRQIEENPEQFDVNVQELETEDESLSGKKQVVLDLEEFIDSVKKSWGTEYEEHFNEVLPGVQNDLRQDIFLTNVLYNPVFLSYRFKNMALKSEYAYLHYLSQTPNSKSLNFGAVLKRDDDWKKRTVLLASDGGVNLSNRLHTIKREFIDFLVAYTGKPLVRIYEGFNDFNVGSEYMSSKILLPSAKQHSKYLKELQKGKLPQADTVSRVTRFNQNFIDHINYCADSARFMQQHSVPVNKLDKKGNQIVQYVQPIRYIDLTDGIIYTQMEDGKLVDKNGFAYGQRRIELEDVIDEPIKDTLKTQEENQGELNR